MPVSVEDHSMDVLSLAFIPLESTAGHFRDRLQGGVDPDGLWSDVPQQKNAFFVEILERNTIK